MADAFISAVAGRLIAILEEQIRSEFNLVTGVETKIRKLSSDLNRVRDMLVDADRRGFQDKSIKKWLKRLEETSYEMDDILDEWSISLRMEQLSSSDQAPPKQKKVCPFIPSPSCLCFKRVATRRDIGMKIKIVKAKLDDILEDEKQYKFLKNHGAVPSNQLERVTTSLVEVEEVKGREDDKDILVSKLIENSAHANQSVINLISIVGTGGIGKTTLAQLVYNDSRVDNCFPLKIWICVSDPFDEVKIAKEIVEQVRKRPPSTNLLEMLLKDVTELVSGKKFLLVLDDVWTEDNTKWGRLRTCLKHGEVGSSVLVTTRNEKVAINMGTTKEGIHRLGQLSDGDCWLLLRRIAFFGKSEEEGLLEIGWQVAKKCKGLPLAAKVLGSLLSYKNTVEEWENVLNNETWKLEEAKLELFPHLVLSYNDLPPTQKRCFSYCAVFPKDHRIDVDMLIRNWMALGYLSYNGDLESELELRGRGYFNNLAMRSLFQDFVKDDDNIIYHCKMHDIVHDFAQFLRESDDLKNSDGGTSNCRSVCDLSLVSRSQEYRSLIYLEERSLDICNCLTSLRVLSLRTCGLQGVATKIEKLIHLRDLDLSENKLSAEDLKAICKLFNLQTLLLYNCNIEEIPTEIGNLVQLRHLDLSSNHRLKKLPESICYLRELRNLNVGFCIELSELPQGIHNLVKIDVLSNYGTSRLNKYPQGFSQLTGLREIDQFCGGSEWTKLGYLKELNRLSKKLRLNIQLANMDEDVVGDAREAELVKKIHLKTLDIIFVEDERDEIGDEGEALCMDVLDALRPHANLQNLFIYNFEGSKFPRWIVSPDYHLKDIFLDINYCSSLPPFGMLPCLEKLKFNLAFRLEFLGREFLEITSSSPSSSIADSSSSSTNMIVGFPKLKALEFHYCPNWKEWEDITIEEEESANLSVMPCLSTLIVQNCPNLTELPHRLLRKVTSLKCLGLYGSTQLVERFKDTEDPFRKLISHIPEVELETILPYTTENLFFCDSFV